MVKKYSCKKDISFGLFLLISGIAVTGVIFTPFFINSYDLLFIIISGLFLLSVLGLFLWLWFETDYSIDHETLIVKFGPFKWKIPISEIIFIRLNQKTIGGTWKLTLSWNSMEIRYKNSKSVFITPDRQTDFISDLLRINSKIILKNP